MCFLLFSTLLNILIYRRILLGIFDLVDQDLYKAFFAVNLGRLERVKRWLICYLS